jgi:hypothetical protein
MPETHEVPRRTVQASGPEPSDEEIDAAIDQYIAEAERWERDPEFLAELSRYAYDAETDCWDANLYVAFVAGYELGRKHGRERRHHCQSRCTNIKQPRALLAADSS